MTVAGAEEKDAQSDYEKLMKDSAEKRAADSKTIGEKEGAKADTEAALTKYKEELKSQKGEMMATLEVISALHGECDWLLQYFDVRKEARTNEIGALTKQRPFSAVLTTCCCSRSPETCAAVIEYCDIG